MKAEKQDDIYGIREDDGIACSAQECTGLIPSLPENGEEAERYEELFPYLARAEKTEGDRDGRTDGNGQKGQARRPV